MEAWPWEAGAFVQEEPAEHLPGAGSAVGTGFWNHSPWSPGLRVPNPAQSSLQSQMAGERQSHPFCSGEGAGEQPSAAVMFELFLMVEQEFAGEGRTWQAEREQFVQRHRGRSGPGVFRKWASSWEGFVRGGTGSTFPPTALCCTPKCHRPGVVLRIWGYTQRPPALILRGAFIRQDRLQKQSQELCNNRFIYSSFIVWWLSAGLQTPAFLSLGAVDSQGWRVLCFRGLCTIGPPPSGRQEHFPSGDSQKCLQMLLFPGSKSAPLRTTLS